MNKRSKTVFKIIGAVALVLLALVLYNRVFGVQAWGKKATE